MKHILIVAVSVLLTLYLNTTKAASLKDEYQLKVLCGKQAEKWFEKEYGKNGVISKKDFTGGGHAGFENHYNRKLNVCLIKQSLMLNDGAINKEHVWHMVSVFDLNESKEYGSFTQNGNLKTMDCVVNGKRCQNKDEFENLINPYMEE